MDIQTETDFSTHRQKEAGRQTDKRRRTDRQIDRGSVVGELNGKSRAGTQKGEGKRGMGFNRTD